MLGVACYRRCKRSAGPAAFLGGSFFDNLSMNEVKQRLWHEEMMT